MKSVMLEYGQGEIEAHLPGNTEVFIPGDTVPDPPFLQDPLKATQQSLANPLGMPPISKLVQKGSTVTISFPDKVKGGYQETSHRKTSIPLIIDVCLGAGVEKSDIKLICSNGLHRKCTDDEIAAILGDKIFQEFMPSGQIINHDSEDWDNLVDLGTSNLGDPVIMNKEVFDSDLPILIGHVLGNPYGGYSGGYKMAATGIVHWKSIASHHIPEVMHLDDFTPVSVKSTMRKKFDAIGRHMEQSMGKQFFMCDAVLDTKMRQIAVFSGSGDEVQPSSWKVADERTYVPWADEQFDILVFGMPQSFHYGNGHGTNPILMLQAIAANVIRHKRVLKDNCVVICSSICDGFFNDADFPSYRELYEIFQSDSHQELPDLAKYGEEFCSRPDYIHKYRYEFGYHPFHAFSMISCGHIGLTHCSAIYIVGAHKPGYARAMGMTAVPSFEDALLDARRYSGGTPKILVLPRTFKTTGVHLMMRSSG